MIVKCTKENLDDKIYEIMIIDVIKCTIKPIYLFLLKFNVVSVLAFSRIHRNNQEWGQWWPNQCVKYKLHHMNKTALKHTLKWKRLFSSIESYLMAPYSKTHHREMRVVQISHSVCKCQWTSELHYGIGFPV